MSVAEGRWPVVGATGARFGSSRSRHRARRDDLVYSAADESVRVPDAAQVTESVSPAETAGGDVTRGAHRIANGAVRVRNSAGVEDMDHQTSSFVRPFVMSGGRTRAEVELPLEALVSTVESAMGADGAGPVHEHRVVLDLCRHPRSIMEVAALAGIPLGVARVLVGDLAATGELTVHRTVDRVGPGVDLLERVLTGLHEL
ncbi:MAG: DUF742 domain-containing protein [Rhodococcus sp.]|nr:DUF742 domain-containing protein [Rhodococcus sp. (in: high G+C Gram-positive bacteria)]